MKNENLIALGEVLKAWRLYHGISLYKVSELTHINYRVLKNLESGKDTHLRGFIRYVDYIESVDEKFNVWDYYKCWFCLYDERLMNIERTHKRSQIEKWLKLAQK